jgi:hypothetical protein
MPGVQFFGAKSVLDAYRARGLQTWGLFQQKQFINAGSSEAELTTFLNMLTTASDSVYTLKVYKDADADDITDKTECNGSFNFKLTAAGAITGTGSGGTTTTDIIVGKIRTMVEDEISEAIERRMNGEGRKKDWGEIITGYMEDPDSLIGVITALKGLFATRQGTIQPAAIGTVDTLNKEPMQPTATGTSQELIMRRIATAIDILQRNDPLILEHLEKLARLSMDDPDMFKVLIKKINLL